MESANIHTLDHTYVITFQLAVFITHVCELLVFVASDTNGHCNIAAWHIYYAWASYARIIGSGVNAPASIFVG